MNEWVRLTQEGDDENDLAIVTIDADVDAVALGAGYVLDGQIERNTDVFPFRLTTAELNALSRHAPEVKAREQQVKALVDAVDILITRAPSYLDNEEEVPVELWDPVAAALFDIKEASE